MRYNKGLWSILALAGAVALGTPVWGQSMPGAMPGGEPQQAEQADLSEGTVRDVQQVLKDKGHYAGPIDGKWGAETQAALKAFQESSGLAATGQLDADTKAKLGL